MRYAEKLWSLKWSIGLLVVLQAFDVLSTMLALEAHEGATEDNPVMRLLLGDGGFESLVIAKWAVLALVFIAVAIDPLHKPYVPASIITMDIVYGVVLAGNFATYGVGSGDWLLPVAFWALLLAMATVAVDEVFFRRRRQDGTPVTPGP